MPLRIEQVFGGLLRANHFKPIRRWTAEQAHAFRAREKARGEDAVVFPARESLPYFLFAFLAAFLAGFLLATFFEAFFALFFFTATVTPLVS